MNADADNEYECKRKLRKAFLEDRNKLREYASGPISYKVHKETFGWREDGKYCGSMIVSIWSENENCQGKSA